MAREPSTTADQAPAAAAHPPTWTAPGGATVEGPAADPVARSGRTVTVACKLPNGLTLRLFRWVKRSVPVLGGGYRDEQMAEPMGEPVTLNGPAHLQNEGPRSPIIPGSGYALTFGVPLDFWKEWVAQNEGYGPLVKGMIFAHESNSHVEGFAQEHRTSRSGLERLDPDNLPNLNPRVKITRAA